MLLTGWLPDTNKRAEGEAPSVNEWFALLDPDLSDEAEDLMVDWAERICLSTLDMDLSCRRRIMC